jgi:hypothetical protein
MNADADGCRKSDSALPLIIWRLVKPNKKKFDTEDLRVEFLTKSTAAYVNLTPE